MTLRRKLLTLLVALATTAMLLVAAGFWATTTQQAAHDEMEDHLMRSLLLQRIDSTGRILLRGQFAAVVADTPGARPRFESLEAGVREDLERWSKMPETQGQASRRRAVASAFEAAIGEIHATFALMDRDQTDAALERLLAYDRAAPFRAFREAIAEQSEAQLRERAAIRAKVDRTRETVQIGLATAAVAVLSLVLLFAAYLSGEVFRPLHELGDALDAASRGDRTTRLEEGRDDELGATSRSFNRLMDALEDGRSAADGEASAPEARGARLEVQRRLLGLREALSVPPSEAASAAATLQMRHELDLVLEGIQRMTNVASSVNLTLQHVEVAPLIHAVVSTFSLTLGARGIGVEVFVDPGVGRIVADQGKLTAALVEVVRHAIDSLPERGGRVGIRAIPDFDDEGFVLIEIADDGLHGDSRRYERALGSSRGDSRDPAEVSLALAFDVFVEHGGRVEIDSATSGGTRTLLRIPSGTTEPSG